MNTHHPQAQTEATSLGIWLMSQQTGERVQVWNAEAMMPHQCSLQNNWLPLP